MDAFEVVLTIGLVCSAIAALMAYTIASGEYAHHFAEKSKAFRQALETALFTLFFFVILILILSYVLPRFV